MEAPGHVPSVPSPKSGTDYQPGSNVIIVYFKHITHTVIIIHA